MQWRAIACGVEVQCALIEAIGCGIMLEDEVGGGMRIVV
jgi:hypothetical protein